MASISIPNNPVPALDYFNATVQYSQDQNAVYARQDVTIDNAVLTVGDTFTFNGVNFTYKTVLGSPTDFTGNESFVAQFNSNPDFSADYFAEVTNGIFGKPEALTIRITALRQTSELNITASRATINADTIELSSNVAGASRYSKNDSPNFAQLARIVGTQTENEQVTESPLYVFELSTQIQSQLNYYDFKNKYGTIFTNDGSFKDLEIQFGTRFSSAGSSYRTRQYDPPTPFFAYMGKAHALGLLTDRIGSKVSNTELYEAQSFLINEYNASATLQRHIEIEYTDLTTTTGVSGSVGNPVSGIITTLAYVQSFASLVDTSKTIKSWTVSLADSGGAVIYEGQKYVNSLQDCTTSFQVLFTNVYGGIEVVTFRTESTNTFQTESQDSKEAYLPNQFKEFNFVTDKSETVSISEQSITANEYEILKGLPQSKYTYLVDGTELKPVKLTGYTLNENTFNANFKCLESL